MSPTKRTLLTLLLIVIVIPALLIGAVLAIAVLDNLLEKHFDQKYYIPAILTPLLSAVPALAAFLFGRLFPPPVKNGWRHAQTVLVPLVAWILATPFAMVTSLLNIPFGRFPYIWLAAPLVIVSGFAFGRWLQLKTVANKRIASIALLLSCLLFGVFAFQIHNLQSHMVPTDIARTPPHLEGRFGDGGFMGSQLITPNPAPGLTITAPYPHLDGATAMRPLYASAAQAIYVGVEEAGELLFSDLYDVTEPPPSPPPLVRCTTTRWAFSRLISNEPDRPEIIFAAAPSEAQVEEARKLGFEYKLTPIARDAFVFMVNKKNPVTNLTMDQIRKIYSGRISNWEEVGGANARILAFQRSKGSGSQTTMERQVMQGVQMRPPLTEEHPNMIGTVVGLADYHNAETAIGYSFRYYINEMVKANDIRLLAIDGVPPTPENIRSGRYPLVTTAYMITARPLSPNAQKLFDWFLSKEGQAFVEQAGYVSFRKQ